MNSSAFCVIVLVTSCNCLQLPSSFKKCDRRRSDFNQCLSEAIYGAVRFLDKPLESHGLPSLYDIDFPSDVIAEFGNRTYGLRQKYSKFRAIGLSKPQSIKARLDFGILNSTLIIESFYSESLWECECEAQGTVVLLPLNVITPIDLIFENPKITFIFELEEYEKGTTYFRVVDSALDVKTMGVKVDFKQLFSNRRLNEEYNSELSAKGLKMFTVFKYFEMIFAPYFGSVFNDFLEKVPIAEMFDG